MDIRSSVLLTDFYQLTMLQGYLERGRRTPQSLKFRETMPRNGDFLWLRGWHNSWNFRKRSFYS